VSFRSEDETGSRLRPATIVCVDHRLVAAHATTGSFASDDYQPTTLRRPVAGHFIPTSPAAWGAPCRFLADGSQWLRVVGGRSRQPGTSASGRLRPSTPHLFHSVGSMAAPLCPKWSRWEFSEKTGKAWVLIRPRVSPVSNPRPRGRAKEGVEDFEGRVDFTCKSLLPVPHRVRECDLATNERDVSISYGSVPSD
jgi:hypothetical protein